MIGFTLIVLFLIAWLTYTECILAIIWKEASA